MTSSTQENLVKKDSAAAEDVEQALKISSPSPLGANLKASVAAKGRASDPLIEKSKTRRYFYLDATRIAAVICVAIDHGAPQFGEWNAVFTQNWVLQLLFTVSGVSFALSRQSLSGYLGRLFWYFMIGVLINMSAWTLASLDWRHNFFGMVFQFWFVAGLMIYSLLLYPLKAHLQKTHSDAIRTFGSDDPDFIFELPAVLDAAKPTAEPTSEPAEEPAIDAEGGRNDEDSSMEAPRGSDHDADGSEGLFKAMAVVALALAGVTILMFEVMEPACQAYMRPHLAKLFAWMSPGETPSSFQKYWDMPSNVDQMQSTVRSFCSYIHCSLCSVCIVILFPMLHNRTSIVGWLVFANMFLNRVLLQRHKDERAFHGFDIFFLSFVIAHLGLRHRAKVATVIVRYWFVWLIMCGIIWTPGTHERLDASPPSEATSRLRVNSLDAFFILAWLAAGEYLFDDAIFTQDKMEFLNWWALAVFLFHKGIHILFGFPVNWMILVGLVPVCYYFTAKRR